MKNLLIILSLLASQSVFASSMRTTQIFCSQGDYDTSIRATDQVAFVHICNTDWSCAFPQDLTLQSAANLSDSNYARYVSSDKRVQLAISRKVGPQKQVEVLMTSQTGFLVNQVSNCFYEN